MSSSAKFVGLGLEALKDNFKELKRPYKLNFSITYMCQSRCLTCNIWQIRPKGELSLDEIREFARKNNHFRWIGITGGEPFLRSDIVEIVKAFHENNKELYLLTIPTNSLTNKSTLINRIEQILKLGIPKVSITLSLDGYRELHDKIRGVPGNYDKAISIAKDFKEMQKTYKNLFFIFGYTMSKFNRGALEQTYESVKREIPDTTRDDFHVNFAQTSEVYYNNSDLDFKADREDAANELAAFIGNRRTKPNAISILETLFLRNLVEYIRSGRQPMKYKSLDASLFMDSYGNVYPSIMWDRKVGNIRQTDYDLAPILSGEAARSVREIIRSGNEPGSWTSCEAYQSVAGNLHSFVKLGSKPVYKYKPRIDTVPSPSDASKGE